MMLLTVSIKIIRPAFTFLRRLATMAGSTSAKPIFNDKAYYDKALHNCESVSVNGGQVLQEWIDGPFFSGFVEELVTNVSNCQLDNPLNVLGVGSGDGMYLKVLLLISLIF